MEQVLHGSARTTPAVRRAIQASSQSLAKLAARYGLDPKTVAKWRGHTTTEDAPMGPTNPVSTVLSPLEEAAAVAFRQRTLLPLDDCLYALQEAIPHLSRSALHRLFQRHGISRLPAEEAPDGAKKKKFKHYPIGYFHVDFAEVRTEDGKAYLLESIKKCGAVGFGSYRQQFQGRNLLVSVPPPLARQWQCPTLFDALPFRRHRPHQQAGLRRAAPRSHGGTGRRFLAARRGGDAVSHP